MKRTNRIIALLSFLCLCGVQAIGEPPAVRAVFHPARARSAAPDFRLQDAVGKSISLSSLRGKVVLLNFWATECGGCREELPYFAAFDRQYRRQGLRTLGISMEVIYQNLPGSVEGWVRVKPFVKDYRIAYPVLMADGAMSAAFNIDEMPATYLIDRQGRIAARYVGVVDRGDVETNLIALLAEHL